MSAEVVPFHGLLLSDDLIFTSRVTGEAHQQNLVVKPARSSTVLVDLARTHAPGGILIDLANPGLNLPELLQTLKEICPQPPRVMAYGSHVDTETLRAAREAGCDPVLPRSKFVEDLPHQLGRWLGKQEA